MLRITPVLRLRYHLFTLRAVDTLTASMLACLLLLLDALPVQAAIHPGFRTYGIWQAETQTRLDVNVWYPVARTPSTVRYGEWSFRVNRRATPMEGAFPLILISHGTAEDRFFHHNLATELAKQGFIVVAATHPGDNTQNMDNLFTVRQFTGRLRDFETVIAALKGDAYLGPHIDMQRIGVVGFGAGADAALLAAGGHIDQRAWEHWKADATPDMPYMKPWANKRLEETVQATELRQSHASPLLRAAVVVAPAYDMFFDKHSLTTAACPVLLITRVHDTLTPLQIAASLASGSRIVNTGNSNYLDYIALPEKEMDTPLPGVALPSLQQHLTLAKAMIDETSRFLLEVIGKPN